MKGVKSSKSDVYTTCEGGVLRRRVELRSSGVHDGRTVQIMNMMHGGGKRRNQIEVDPEVGEAEEEKNGTPRPGWADAEDNEEGKEAPRSIKG